MQTSSLRRQMKNMVNNYTEAEIKVREATSNDHWGPPSSLMSEIASLTFNVVAFTEVMGMIWRRLNDHGKNWRHVYKALTLLDYLIKTGSERVAVECRENIYTIHTLRDFQYIDRDGRDQGINVREKAKQLVALLRDEEKLNKERSQALKTKTRIAGGTSSLSSGSLPPPYPGHRSSQGGSSGVQGDEFQRCRGSPSSFNSSSSSPQLAPDMEQARPVTSGEEELQLKLALAMSREECEKPVQCAPVNQDMDEDTQMQLALSLSKEEHQQEQLSRQGDESMLRKALEESKRQMESKGGTAFMDLVDVFAVPSDPPSTDHRWTSAAQQAATARPAGMDPWDSQQPNTSRGASPWMVPLPSSSPPPPWEPPADPWDGPPNVSDLTATGPAWASPANTASLRVDPFSARLEGTALEGAVRDAFPRTGSPSDGDLFDEAMDGGLMNVNGRGESSPELFDLSHLGESLGAPSPRTCRTPESFLDPTAASLVNLDTLIPVNPQAKNPFLSGLSAASANNPFQTEQPKVTLNQMGSASSAPHSSLPYSASLPLPMSHQPASLPSSLTHPTQPGLVLPGNLPEPLLPFSSASAQGSQASQSSQNPFL
ncbi:epsin-3 isoform X2 [Hippoglossus hippoglossus]|uniref:epsin-3 isoform X2 n=1 Tax=Hippoglossus hippoglossus TaxID=8267 RepID=UPI00148BC2AF|nr:epsin-3 isoform X2 [Hippoglossus hippoglossus]XP_035036050.1 epsin-3 isoform X2 [Hippoglossus stenolepis]